MKDQPRRYATPAAFRVALEARLRSIARTDAVDLQRLRGQVSFDRLLARLFGERNAPWLLKGGYAIELRISTARGTKDLDLCLPAATTMVVKERVWERLQSAVGADLGDFFVFAVERAMRGLDAAPEGGARYPVVANVAGRVFTRFHLERGELVIESCGRV